MARTIKLYKLPDTPTTVGLREARRRDAAQITQLLNGYLSGFGLTQEFSQEEVAHL
jgi:glycylpeptide N-tetradecanoyltransferase